MSVKLTKKDRKACNLGQLAITGGPGRPIGSKNKFTLIKEQMAELWQEENCKEKFRGIINSGDKSFMIALREIISILPKDPIIDQSEHTHITYKWLKDERNND